MTLDPEGSELHPLIERIIRRDGRPAVVDGVVGTLARVRYSDGTDPEREWIPLAEAESSAEPREEWPFSPWLFLLGSLGTVAFIVAVGWAMSLLSR